MSPPPCGTIRSRGRAGPSHGTPWPDRNAPARPRKAGTRCRAGTPKAARPRSKFTASLRPHRQLDAIAGRRARRAGRGRIERHRAAANRSKAAAIGASRGLRLDRLGRRAGDRLGLQNRRPQRGSRRGRRTDRARRLFGRCLGADELGRADAFFHLGESLQAAQGGGLILVEATSALRTSPARDPPRRARWRGHRARTRRSPPRACPRGARSWRASAPAPRTSSTGSCPRLR